MNESGLKTLVPKAAQEAHGTLRSSGGSDTHDVGRLPAHPDHSPVDPSQQPLHHQLHVHGGGALRGNTGSGAASSHSAYFSSGHLGQRVSSLNLILALPYNAISCPKWQSAFTESYVMLPRGQMKRIRYNILKMRVGMPWKNAALIPRSLGLAESSLWPLTQHSLGVEGLPLA